AIYFILQKFITLLFTGGSIYMKFPSFVTRKSLIKPLRQAGVYTLASLLAVQSLLTGTWAFSVADAAGPAVINVDAYYSSGVGYTGIGVDFSTEDTTNATAVEIILHGGDVGPYSINATQTLLDNLNSSPTS